MAFSFNPLAIEDDLWLVDTGLYHPERGALVLADLHLGYEEALRAGGAFVPDAHFDELRARLARTFDLLDVTPDAPLRELILNGDLRQAFGRFKRGEWRELKAFFELVEPLCERIVVVEGNHDPSLGFLGRRHPNVTIHREHRARGWLYLHGDRLPELCDRDACVVIGHEHPALSLRDPVTGRQERYKAFLRGTYRGRALWVLPSCNALVKGTDLSRDALLSPLLREAARARLDVYARDDSGRLYPFGPLGQLLVE